MEKKYDVNTYKVLLSCLDKLDFSHDEFCYTDSVLIKATDSLNSECIFILTEKTIYFIMEYNDLKERMANLNDKKISELNKLIIWLNNDHIGTCFNINYKEGKISCRSYIHCLNILPSEEMITHCIQDTQDCFYEFHDAFFFVLVNSMTYKEALEVSKIMFDAFLEVALEDTFGDTEKR